MFKPGPGIALVSLGRGAAFVARKLLRSDLSWDDDPPLPPRQQEVPGAHQVGISVELTAGVSTRGDHPANMIGKIYPREQIIR